MVVQMRLLIFYALYALNAFWDNDFTEFDELGVTAESR
jgi:hypothetical protein